MLADPVNYPYQFLNGPTYAEMVGNFDRLVNTHANAGPTGRWGSLASTSYRPAGRRQP